MKDGVLAREVYQHAVNFVKDKQPDLEKYFVKNIGFAVREHLCHFSSFEYWLAHHKTGIEFRDASYILSPKNNKCLRKNMVFNLSLGFTGLTDKSGSK